MRTRGTAATGDLGPHLQQIGRALTPDVTAVLVVSAHWQSPGVRVMATRAPKTVHDFGGFPALRCCPGRRARSRPWCVGPASLPVRRRECAGVAGIAAVRDRRGRRVATRPRPCAAARAHPTEEHYLPLLVAVGASTVEDRAELIAGGMTHEVLSMDSFGFGLPEAANAPQGTVA